MLDREEGRAVRGASKWADRLLGRWLAAALVLVTTAWAGGCAATRFAYIPDELRAIIAERAPEIPPGQLLIPFELLPEQVRQAQDIVRTHLTAKAKAEALALALFDPEQFGLVFDESPTADAITTLQRKRGNCLSIASVYVGLARAVGLRAFFLDFSHRISEVQYKRGMVVNVGHVTAVVEAGGEKKALSLGTRYTVFPVYRYIDDLEAVAHFYNNRGYDRIRESSQEDLPAAWAQAAADFRLATRIKPGFVRAWNNLGVAQQRLGQGAKALASYRRAIALDPEFPAAHTNLGLAHLAAGRLPEALRTFKTALDLDSDNPLIWYYRGLTLFRQGQLDQARKALEQALGRDEHHARARRLLRRIQGSEQPSD
jgi:tetratricopeptide (TPR) repeat protein